MRNTTIDRLITELIQLERDHAKLKTLPLDTWGSFEEMADAYCRGAHQIREKGKQLLAAIEAAAAQLDPEPAEATCFFCGSTDIENGSCKTLGCEGRR